MSEPSSVSMAGDGFRAFGTAHLIVLGLVFSLTLTMILVARRNRESRLVRGQEWALGLLLLAKFPVALLWGWSLDMLDRESWLPLHLCELAALTGGVALIRRNPLCAELTYFWGMAGTLNGLITPALLDDFPHPRFIAFFWLHAGVVAAAFYLPLGAGLRPRPGAVPRTILASLVYMAVAAAANHLLGTNYGFLAGPPPTRSLIDWLGPWPWYLLSLVALGSALYLLLYAPFFLLQRRGRRPRSAR